MPNQKEQLPIVSDQERAELLLAGERECQKTKLPVEVQFAQRYGYSERRYRVEKFKYLFEFDARGIPYPESYNKGGRELVRLGRGEPGVYISMMDSTIQRTLEQMDKDRRKEFQPKASKGPKKVYKK